MRIMAHFWAGQQRSSRRSSPGNLLLPNVDVDAVFGIGLSRGRVSCICNFQSQARHVRSRDAYIVWV